MSDFDKEAERERLREKYERDEQKREVTERMSELLLKGATMTNAHCQDCGDPIFRYDGQEFCPTCQKAVERTGGDGADGEGETEGDADGATDPDENGDREELEVATPSEARVQFGAEAAEAADADAPTGDANDREQAPTQQPAPRAGGDRSATTGGGGDLGTAAASLAREVAKLARAAEACEDLGQERELLAATREAAEALSAVREAGR